MVFSRSGDLLASASEDMTVKLWQLSPDPSHPSLGASLRHEDEVASVAFSPDQPILATAGEGTVQLWNVARPTSPALSDIRSWLATEPSFRWRSVLGGTF